MKLLTRIAIKAPVMASTATLILTTIISASSYAYDYVGRVDVYNSPLNVRSCASSSCGRVGRGLLRDDVIPFDGTYSANKWLAISYLGGYSPYEDDYVYGKYIKKGSRSLLVRYNNNAKYTGVTTSNLSLRDGPMMQYPRLRVVPKGTEVTVRGRNGDYFLIYWMQDKYINYYGYVHSNWVKRK